MDINYERGISLKDFLINNQQSFEKKLLEEAVNVRYKIEEIHRIGNINLLGNAHKLVLYVVEENNDDLIDFAKFEGIAWAKFSLTLAFKLEWIQSIRRTLWNFIYIYDINSDTEVNREVFYEREKQMNTLIDLFFTNFFMSYSKYKDALIEKQKLEVRNLSVPIIPISDEVCILPLIGTIDDQRLSIIEERVLTEISNRSIEKLIMDLSGVAPMEPDSIKQLATIIDAIYIMGCKTVLTGLRKEVVILLKNPAASFHGEVAYKGTLQLALNEIF
ncbi:MAG: STAS domain-containing protein [Bacillus sp. (in: Bacteria)]|nr:STAS domain-containing protein [Bacillus sp. (in: firmicutes)]